MASASTAQLLFTFLTVIVMVRGTPVRSETIFVATSEDGFLVGKGPAVSDGDTVQLSVVLLLLPPELLLPLPALEPDEALSSSVLHACKIFTLVRARPASPIVLKIAYVP
jgi:hypothetical protein